MFKSISFYLAVGGVIACLLLVQKLRTKPPEAPPVAQPAKAPYIATIGGRGIVESEAENVRLAAPVAGLVTAVYKNVGDAIDLGEPLFQIDDRSARTDLLLQEAQVPVLQARIAEAEALAAERRDKAGRTNPLVRGEVLSQDEGQRTKFQLTQAEAAVARARQELEQQKVAVLAARTRLDVLTVRAPRAGQLLQVNVRAGEYAQPAANADPLMLLGCTKTLQLRVDIDEESASRVNPQAEATAFVKGIADKPIGLDLVRVEPYIVPKRSLSGQSNERVDTRVLQIIYRLRPTALPIYVGQQMDVYLRDTTKSEPGRAPAASAARITSAPLPLAEAGETRPPALLRPPYLAAEPAPPPPAAETTRSAAARTRP